MKIKLFQASLFLIALILHVETWAGRIQDFKNYLDQIEDIAKITIPKKDFLIKVHKAKKYGERILSREELDQHHNDFTLQKNRLIKEWEENTEQDWPQYNQQTECLLNNTCHSKKKGWNYDAHHIIPQSHNGPNEWWNLIPLDVRQHNLIHGMPVFSRNLEIEYKNTELSNSYVKEYILSEKKELDPAFCCTIFHKSCVGVRGGY